MKWFSGLNSQNSDAYINYIKMYKVAVVTAKNTNPELQPYLILDGEIDEHIEDLIKLGVNIVNHRVTFSKELIDHYKEDTIALGAYLRIDIPKICNDLKIEDDYILYTDNDVFFCNDVSSLKNLKPKYFMCAGEFNPIFSPMNMNSGVIWMNWRKMFEDYNNFVTFVKNNLSRFVVYDQDALKLYYGDKIESLDASYNYKPYWGYRPFWSIKIIHFHGPKPTSKMEDLEKYPHPNLVTTFFYQLKEKFNNILNDDHSNLLDTQESRI